MSMVLCGLIIVLQLAGKSKLNILHLCICSRPPIQAYTRSHTYKRQLPDNIGLDLIINQWANHFITHFL